VSNFGKNLVVLFGIMGVFVACTANLGSEVTIEPGVYECKARNPGYEDLPVFHIDSETADPEFRQGFGAPSTLTVTTVEGDRITFHFGTNQAGYYCLKVQGGLSVTPE